MNNLKTIQVPANLIQSMISQNKALISSLEDDILFNQGVAAGYWTACNPEDINSPYFETLNNIKDSLRKLMKEKKTLVEFQRILKRSLAGG